MSLTDDQWQDMWEAIKRIEYASDIYTLKNRTLKSREIIKKEVEKIKTLIQSVVGQLE